ncbi:MAG TPA: FN3 associated domain-containing protein, partial [Gaiellaceae bacterium]|nr:FN3 associated domain-containing protein [Gaiellaceae bacterium]
MKVAIVSGGFRLSAPFGSAALSTADAGAGGGWTQHAHGATRSTAFGSETVTMSPSSAEEFLTVGRRQGVRTWRWRIDTPYDLRSTPTGYVGFFDGQRLVPLEIKPVQILGRLGREVTPKGLRWNVVKRAGAWWLELQLNDAKLPVPYTIDPGVFRIASTAGTKTTTGAGNLSAITIPATARVHDVLVLHLAQVSTTAFATPAGWTAITGTAGSNNSTSVYGTASFYHVVVAADLSPTLASWTPAVSTRAVGVVDDFRGIDSTAPIQQNGTLLPAVAGQANTVQCPGITPPAGTSAAQPEHIVCQVGSATSDGGNWATETVAGYANESHGNSGTQVGIATFDREATTTTAIATVASSTLSTSKAWKGTTFGLKDDYTSPVSGAVAIGSPTATAYQASAGSPIYFNGNKSGSFTLSDPITDAQSSVESVNYPAVATAGWTHANETPTTDPSYTSSTYTWTYAGATIAAPSVAERTLTETNGAGLTTQPVVPVVQDVTAPTSAITCNGAACGGWYNASPVAVQISALDTGGAGVTRIVYTTDGTTPTIDGTDTVTNGIAVAGSTAGFNISSQGVNTIEWIAEDDVQNISTVSTQTVQLDTTAPTVTGAVTTTTATGSYNAGTVIPITVNFSENVTVTGTPTLALDTAPAENATYASGSGTSALVFDYTVTAGDTTAALDYAATSSLSLSGGAIQDVAANNATLTLPAVGGGSSLSPAKTITIDTTAPTVIGAVTTTTATGSYNAGTVIPITVNFSENVTVTGTPTLALDTAPAENATYA